MSISDRPLVTLCITTYNQEQYVRDTVLSALAQAYDPLQIVISDDSSSDRTWAIIESEVKQYKDNGGKHIVDINRNSVNLGIMANSQLAFGMAKGELIVACGGDDVSKPNRVERIVEEWIRGGKRALAIYHGAWKIDAEGRCCGELGEFYFREGTLGAVAAYSRMLLDLFGPVSEQKAAEDEVFGNRALIFDGRMYLRENLLKYRVGVGVSSGRDDYRRKQIRVLRDYKLCSIMQGYKDLGCVRHLISDERYESMLAHLKKTEQSVRLWIALWDSDSIISRCRSYAKIIPMLSIGQKLKATLLLLPKSLGDCAIFILNIGRDALNKMRVVALNAR